mmetsp:Transcript_9804/g.13515  ORF Transcript_9804/g.13515 Transcript_9804/m.13515 type:complete len:95 (-) Transcript_9804:360-644(-)
MTRSYALSSWRRSLFLQHRAYVSQEQEHIRSKPCSVVGRQLPLEPVSAQELLETSLHRVPVCRSYGGNRRAGHVVESVWRGYYKREQGVCDGVD